jgi:hypothetical protein
MWFLDQLQPGLTAYNVPGAVRMSGDLDFAALEAGFTEILRRHEIFRTTYDTRHGQPIQVIQPSRPYRLPLVDLQGLGVKAARALAERLEKRNAALPFDLRRGPVVRAVALRMAPDEHRMAMTTHHIAYDMWAREIFIFELATLYEAFSNQRPSP